MEQTTIDLITKSLLKRTVEVKKNIFIDKTGISYYYQVFRHKIYCYYLFYIKKLK